MAFTVLSRFNIVRQCRKDFGVSVWRCPTFLFILMGVVVMASTVIAYIIANRFNSDPEMSALLALATAAITLVIGHVVIRSFAGIVEVGRIKSQFLNSISHQLLTPLTALKWSVNVLESDTMMCDPKEQKEIYGIIKENSNKMVSIVNTLLDISRMETGKVTISSEAFDIGEITKKIIALRARDCEEKNSNIVFTRDPALPRVLGDPVRTRLAIENLIDNAIKYSRSGTAIRVSLKSEENTVVFTIQDSGVGIPAREHKNIFQKFFRAGNEMEHQAKGLGLGLYLVKFIIEASGGTIHFESQEGVGSTFWFSLPAHTA